MGIGRISKKAGTAGTEIRLDGEGGGSSLQARSASPAIIE